MLMRSGETGGLAGCGNLLLRTLGADDAARLHPHLVHIEMAGGTRLLASAATIDHAYFPEAGVVALGESVGGRAPVETAVVGREGMLGWPALLGCERGAHDAVVQGRGGTALMIPSDRLFAACRASQTLWMTMLGFVQSMMVQMARTISVNVENSIEERIARWLLMRHDRLIGDHILVRHDEIAAALGTRRASITDHLHILEGEHLIRCRRGRILVRDRRGLEAFAGDAYRSSVRDRHAFAQSLPLERLVLPVG